MQGRAHAWRWLGLHVEGETRAEGGERFLRRAAHLQQHRGKEPAVLRQVPAPIGRQWRGAARTRAGGGRATEPQQRVCQQLLSERGDWDDQRQQQQWGDAAGADDGGRDPCALDTRICRGTRPGCVSAVRAGCSHWCVQLSHAVVKLNAVPTTLTPIGVRTYEYTAFITVRAQQVAATWY